MCWVSRQHTVSFTSDAGVEADSETSDNNPYLQGWSPKNISINIIFIRNGHMVWLTCIWQICLLTSYVILDYRHMHVCPEQRSYWSVQPPHVSLPEILITFRKQSGTRGHIKICHITPSLVCIDFTLNSNRTSQFPKTWHKIFLSLRRRIFILIAIWWIFN
jgi:hypothetical protein